MNSLPCSAKLVADQPGRVTYHHDPAKSLVYLEKRASKVQVHDTPLSGVKILQPRRFGDGRGFFCEIWNKNTLENQGIRFDFVQDNHSVSALAGTVRGLHFQAPPQAQAKLVRCGRGCLFDVAVDIRKGSPSYGQWFGVELSFENGKQLLIPEGFAHGFVTRAPETEIIYKCSAYYAPETEGALRFDDSDLGIDWGLQSDPILSQKDAEAGFMRDFDSPFIWEGS